MKPRTTAPVELISQFYEEKLYTLSYDLHERYSHLLTGMIHLLRKEEDLSRLKELISHIVDDMKGISNEVTPLSLRPYGAWPAFKRYIQEVEKRFGVPVILHKEGMFPVAGESHNLLVFRILQLIIQMIIEEADTTGVEVRTNEDHIIFIFFSDRLHFPMRQKELLQILQKETNMVLHHQRRGNLWRWTLAKEGME
ncbi:hypothetical protein [Halobacillus litoralis]|uniref:hypothetical protein n=1 Tax=Halobacillus litoralis TaxID=45668 RepID=UPI001CFD5D54|nr:hypothetical protein [Halobacillus litoralis]